MFEQLIARHCSPALAGIKCSNIVSCPKKKYPCIHRDIELLKKELGGGVSFEILHECDSRVLLMVYRRRLLCDRLSERGIRRYLERYGYDSSEGAQPEEYLSYLKSRMATGEFPHEIGVFLGYPLRDICSFINHRDRGCLFVGEWRVYHNPERASMLFSRYKACRAAVERRVLNGERLGDIFKKTA